MKSGESYPDWMNLLGRIERQENGCLRWLGGKNTDGYAVYHVGGRSVRLHRWLYEQRFGPIAPLEDGTPRPLDHYYCDDPSCVNWDHVRPVTVRENVLRGRSIQSRNLAKTHCVRGHPFDERNTYRRSDGRRQCRACGREDSRSRRRAAA